MTISQRYFKNVSKIYALLVVIFAFTLPFFLKTNLSYSTVSLYIFLEGIISVISFLAFQLISRQIISIFGSGSEMYYKFAIKYFKVFLFFTFVNCMQPISSNFFTAIGKPKKGIFLSLTRQILFLLLVMTSMLSLP